MTRGIHLKRLTDNDLGPLGLAEPSGTAAPSHDGPPSPAAPERASPPPNPGPAKDRGESADRPDEAGLDGDWDLPPEIDLAALAREIRSGLEETLDLLAWGPGGDDPPGEDVSRG